MYKAVVAFATSLAGLEGVAEVASHAALPAWAHAITVGFAAIVGGAVWLTKNQDKVKPVVDALDPETATVLTNIAKDPAPVVAKVIKTNVELAEEIIADYK
jgi:hypothetical protein